MGGLSTGSTLISTASASALLLLNPLVELLSQSFLIAHPFGGSGSQQKATFGLLQSILLTRSPVTKGGLLPHPPVPSYTPLSELQPH